MEEVRSLLRQDPSRFHLVVLDGLGSHDRGWKPSIEELKTLAGGCNVAVLTTAGFRVDVDAGCPGLTDLDAGDAAVHADYVLALHRPDEYGRPTPEVGEARLELLVNRHGPLFQLRLAFEAWRARLAAI